MQLNDINFRDPFIVPSEGRYIMTGTEGATVWEGNPGRFLAFTSHNLVEWEGPIQIFRAPDGFWAECNYWAPELHAFGGNWFLFATLKSSNRCRGTQIFISESPTGPFRLHSDGPVTPADWECLDGTLHVDKAGNPWMVFCHEWGQVGDGEICVMRLSGDLGRAIEEPHLLFKASQCPASRGILEGGASGFVTDGPYLFNPGQGLGMLWSTLGEDMAYLQVAAYSQSGNILGPWEQDPKPVYTGDGGHGMLFTSLTGSLKLALHTPNSTPDERPIILDVTLETGCLRMR